ncbi:MAG: colanic acid biosynthesis acetyltransferase WcaF [Lentimicrobiaceae bacterium]|nr:colanic acid biosynthesis acetyltransferase WcaF [Lentimicrobiaceae bacterium]MCO5265942.1 WcaF family extracellular polysaccharide biosynthesis acetyltransferase [Lentimicrobium sp.]
MNKTDLSIYTTGSYNTGAGAVKRGLWYLINILFFINPLNPISRIKVSLLRAFGAKIGKGVVIKPAVNIKYPWKLSIGNYSWIGEKAWIDNLDRVTIGDHCCVSQGAMLLCGNHNFTKTTFDLITKPIHLEDGAWIGAFSIVCPGVICKSHSVLAVNSVATKNLDAYRIYQGNPAIAVKDRIID